MRIHQLIDLLDEALKRANFGMRQEDSNTMAFNGTENTKAFLDILSETNLFNDNVEKAKRSNLYLTSSSVIKFPHNEANQLLNELNHLKNQTELTLAALKEAAGNPKQDINSIYLKIPSQKDFDELSKLTNKLQTIFGQLIYEEPINGKLEIVGAENGSIWFYILLGTPYAVKLIADLVNSAIVVRNNSVNSRYRLELYKQQAVKTGMLEKIQEVINFEADAIIELEANYVYNENFQDEDHEKIARIKNSIKEFSELIDKGVAVEPAMLKEPTIKGLFPDMKNLVGVVSKVKKLENIDNL